MDALTIEEILDRYNDVVDNIYHSMMTTLLIDMNAEKHVFPIEIGLGVLYYGVGELDLYYIKSIEISGENYNSIELTGVNTRTKEEQVVDFKTQLHIEEMLDILSALRYEIEPEKYDLEELDEEWDEEYDEE